MSFKLIYLAKQIDEKFTVEHFDTKEQVAQRIYEFDRKFHHLPVCEELSKLGVIVLGKYIIQEI